MDKQLSNIRPTISNCPNCASAKIDSGEYFHKYGNHRHLICHDCGFEVDNPTEEEIEKDRIAEEKFFSERESIEKEKRRQLYLKLKKEFEIE